MMLKGLRSHQRLAVVFLMVMTVVQCQDSERRAVTEHQLMHDRGRSIQSLRRLIWLSSAMEGLHTAQTRTLTAADTRPGLLLSQPGHRRALLRDMYTPHLAAALDGEK
ncbi:parathyroid hormone 4 [Triplophysa dalaica]|uniref:parathyroid hormone 4 n=1 Tax=Triplophysa dalaica TaxID=1582913 RepID=UPI0024DF750D|nr:parathyroid hormone 4 [Triplophysa dalaica]